MLQELLTDNPESVRWPDALRAGARHPRVRRARSTSVLSRAREKGLDPADLRRARARAERVPEFVAAGLFLQQYLDVLDDQSAIDYADLIAPRRCIEADGAPRRAAGAGSRHVFVDEYQDTDPGQVGAAAGARRRRPRPDRRRRPATSRSTASGAPRCAASSTSRATFPRADGAPAAGGRARHHPPVRARGCCGPSRGVAAAIGRHRRRSPPSTFAGVPRARRRRAGAFGDGPRRRAAPSTPTGPRPSTSPTCCAGPTSRTASRWSEMAVLVRSGRARSRALRRSLGAAGVPVEVASDETPAGRASRRCCRCSTRCAVVVDLDNRRPRPTRPRRRPTGPRRCSTSPLGGLDADDVRAPGPGRCGARDGRRRTARERLPTPSARAGPPGRCSLDRVLDGEPAREPRRARAVGRRWSAPAPRASSADGRHRRGGALGALGRHRLAGAGCAAGVELGGQAARLRPPRPRRDLCALRAAAARPRSRRGHVGVRRASSTPCAPSRSRPTPWPSGACAATPSGCSPPTAPRAWSGASWSSPTSRRAAGPTCAAAPRCSRPTGSAPTGWCRR